MIRLPLVLLVLLLLYEGGETARPMHRTIVRGEGEEVTIVRDGHAMSPNYFVRSAVSKQSSPHDQVQVIDGGWRVHPAAVHKYERLMSNAMAERGRLRQMQNWLREHMARVVVDDAPANVFHK